MGGHVPKGSSAVIVAFPPTGSAVKQGNSTSGSDQLSPSAPPATMSGVYFSVLDPVLMPAVSQQPGAVGTNKHVGSPTLDAEPNNLLGNKHVSPDVSDLELSKNEKAASKTVSSMHKKGAPSKSQVVQKNKVSDPSQSSSPVSDGSSDYANQSTDEAVIPKEGTVLLVDFFFLVGYLLHCCKEKRNLTSSFILHMMYIFEFSMLLTIHVPFP